MKLYIKKDYKAKTCTGFLTEYFTDLCPETFFDKELKKTQCMGGAYRSISDLSFLCKTQFPSLHYNKIYYYIVKFILNREKYRLDLIKTTANWVYICLSYCGNIKKFVVHAAKMSANRVISGTCMLNNFNTSYDNYKSIDGIKLDSLLKNYKKFKNA